MAKQKTIPGMEDSKIAELHQGADELLEIPRRKGGAEGP